MAQNPPPGTQRCCPYLFYDDIDAAVRFLCDTFGFESRVKVPGPDGRAMHAQVALGDSVVMMGATHNLPEEGSYAIGRADAGPLHASLYIFVDDVDAHYAHAKANGAKINTEPETQFWGDRMYSCADPEGQFWAFATPVADIDPAAGRLRRPSRLISERRSPVLPAQTVWSDRAKRVERSAARRAGDEHATRC